MNFDSTPESPVFTSRRIEQQWIRMQGVKMVRAGMPESDVARYFHVSMRAVFKWVAAFYARGSESVACPALQARTKTRGALILFADEAGMRSDYHADTTWAPRGRTPVVRASGQRVSAQMLSAVGTGGQLQFMLHEGLVNAAVFRTLLEQLMLGATQPIFLVVDGHSIHKAKLESEYVASTNGLLGLHFLPPYLPQLNPDEQVWKNVKERVAKQNPLDEISLRLLILAALERLQTLQRLCEDFSGNRIALVQYEPQVFICM